jgi:uncharacterized membrane protein
MSDDLLTTEEEKDGGELQRFVIKGLLVGLGIFAVIVALILVLSPSEGFIEGVAVLRDILMIIIGLSMFLTVFGLAVLILQVTRLIELLQTEAKPILQDTKETLNTAKGTAKFVSQNVTRPLIRLTAFLIGVRTFIRELGGIRRAIRKNPEGKSDE